MEFHKREARENETINLEFTTTSTQLNRKVESSTELFGQWILNMYFMASANFNIINVDILSSRQLSARTVT